MKNEKGFSLVEVLAIIVVLAIILAIAVPKIFISIDNVRKEAFREGANSIIDAVKLEYSQKYKKDEKAITYSFFAGGYAANSPQLKLKGDLPQSGSVYLGVDGKIALAVQSHDGKYCAKKKLNEIEVTVEKFKADSCTVDSPKGPIGITHSVTINYKDGGWTNGDRIIQISSTSSLDDETNSKYLTTIKYQFSKDGKINDNNWSTYDRTSKGVTVTENGTLFAKLVYIDSDTKTETNLASDNKIGFKIDKTNPTCKFTVTKTNGNKITSTNGWYADDVKVSVALSDTGGSGINKKATKINGILNSNNYITVTEDGSTKVSAIVFDNAGNSNSCTTTIKKDSVTPQCDIQIVSGTEGNDPWYKSNVKFKFVVKNGKSDILKKSIANYEVKNDANYTYSVEKNGETKISGFVQNEAGNIGTCEKTVYIDKTAPTCSASGDSTTWTNGDRTIKWGCSDKLSGCATGYTGGSKTYSTSTKTAAIAQYTIKDNAGNTTTCSARTANVYVDKTAPTCSWSGESTTWTRGDRTITATCSDTGSGCKTSNYKKSYTSGTTKTATLSYTMTDNVGNTTTCSKTANVYVDKDKPTAQKFVITSASINSNGSNKPGYTATIKGKDTAGITKIQYSTDGGTTWKNVSTLKTGTTGTGTQTFTISKTSNYTLRARVCDAAGNCTEVNPCKSFDGEKCTAYAEGLKISPKRIYVHQLYTRTLERNVESEEVVTKWANYSTLSELTLEFFNSPDKEAQNMLKNKGKEYFSARAFSGIIGREGTIAMGSTAYETYIKNYFGTDEFKNNATNMGLTP